MSGPEFKTVNFRPLADDMRRIPGVNDTPVTFEMPSTESMSVSFSLESALNWVKAREERRHSDETMSVSIR